MNAKNYLLKNDFESFESLSEKDLKICPKTEWIDDQQWKDFTKKSTDPYWLSFEEIFCEITGFYPNEISDEDFIELVKTKNLGDQIKYREN